MKTISYFIFIAVLSGLLFIACDSDDVEITEVISCDDGVQNGDETGIDCGGSCRTICPPENALEGEVVSVIELTDEREHILSGPLIIRDGGELIIQAGTVIKAMRDRNAYIAVAQGGKIFVYGSADDPVTITSNEANPEPGDWGGLLIFGKAPINSAIVDRSDLLDYFYGGGLPDDSSGLLRYLRLEYTGMQAEEDLNFDGISMFGVGRFTTMNHIQVKHSLGHGMRLIGGTISPERLVISNNAKHGIIFSDGWQGSSQAVYFLNNTMAPISISNNTMNPSSMPITSGQLSEMSLVSSSPNIGIQYGDGGGLMTLSTIYTAGLETGVFVVGASATARIDAGDFLINPIFFDNISGNFNTTNYLGPANFITESANMGAGDQEQLPTWALDWTLPF